MGHGVLPRCRESGGGKAEVRDGFGEEEKMGGKRLDESWGKLKGKEGGDGNGVCGEGRHG